MSLSKQELIDFSQKLYDSYQDTSDAANSTSEYEIADKFDDDKPNRISFHKVNEEIVSLHQELYSTFGEKRTNLSDTKPHKYFGLKIPTVLGYHTLKPNITYSLKINYETLYITLTPEQNQWQSLINVLNSLTDEFNESGTISNINGNNITITGANFNNSYLNFFIIKNNEYTHRIKSIINTTTIELENVSNLSIGDSITIHMDKKYTFSYDSEDIKVVMNLNNTSSDFQEARLMLQMDEEKTDLLYALSSDLTKDIYNYDDTTDLFYYGAQLKSSYPQYNAPFNIFHKNIYDVGSNGLIKTPLEMPESNGSVATYPKYGETGLYSAISSIKDVLFNGYDYGPSSIDITPTTTPLKYAVTGTINVITNSWVYVSDGTNKKVLKITETSWELIGEFEYKYYITFDMIPTDYNPTIVYLDKGGFSEASIIDLGATDTFLLAGKQAILDYATTYRNDLLYVKDAILRKWNAFDSDNADYLVSVYTSYLQVKKWLELDISSSDVRFTTANLNYLFNIFINRNSLLSGRLAYIKTTGGYGRLGLASISGDTGNTENEESYIASQKGDTSETSVAVKSNSSYYISIELLRKELNSITNENENLLSDAEYAGVSSTIISEFNNSYTTIVAYLQEILSDPASFDESDSGEFQSNFIDYINKKVALLEATTAGTKTATQQATLASLNNEQEAAESQYTENINNPLLSETAAQELTNAYLAYNSKLDEFIIQEINGNNITISSNSFSTETVNKLIYKQGATTKTVLSFISANTVELNDVVGLTIGDTIEIHNNPMGTSNLLENKLEDIIEAGDVSYADLNEISSLTAANNTTSNTLDNKIQASINDIFRNLQASGESLLENSTVSELDIIIPEMDSSLNVSISVTGKDAQIYFNYADKLWNIHPTYYVYSYQIQGKAKVWDTENVYYDGTTWYPLKNYDSASFNLNDGGLNTVDIGKATTALSSFLLHKSIPIGGTLIEPKNRTISYRFRKVIKDSSTDLVVGYSNWSTITNPSSIYSATIIPDATEISGESWIMINDFTAPTVTGINITTARHQYDLTTTTHHIDVNYVRCPEDSATQVGTKGYYIHRATQLDKADDQIIDTVLETKHYFNDFADYPTDASATYIDTTAESGMFYYYGISAFDFNDNISSTIWTENSIQSLNTVKPDQIAISDISLKLADIGESGYARIYFRLPVNKKVSIKGFNIVSHIQNTLSYDYEILLSNCVFLEINGDYEYYYYDEKSYYDNNLEWWKEYTYFQTGNDSTCLYYNIRSISTYNIYGDFVNTNNSLLSQSSPGYTYQITFNPTVTVTALRGKFIINWGSAVTRRLRYYVILRKRYNIDADYFPISIVTDGTTFNDNLVYYVDKTDPEITDIKYKIQVWNEYEYNITSSENASVDASGFINYRPLPVEEATTSVKYIDDRIEISFENYQSFTISNIDGVNKIITTVDRTFDASIVGKYIFENQGSLKSIINYTTNTITLDDITDLEIGDKVYITDISTMEVVKYKLYYSYGLLGTKYPISHGYNIYTKDKDEILKNFDGINTVIYYQKWDNILPTNEITTRDIDSTYYWVKSITEVGAESVYKLIPSSQASIVIDTGYTTDVNNTKPLLITSSATRENITISWSKPLMFLNTTDLQYVIEETTDTTVPIPIWNQIFTTAKDELSYSFNTYENLKSQNDFAKYGYRVKVLKQNRETDYTTDINIDVTNFIDYQLVSIDVLNVSYQREYATITSEKYNAPNIADIKEFIIYQKLGSSYTEIYRGGLINSGSNYVVSVKCLPVNVELASLPVYTYKVDVVSIFGYSFTGLGSDFIGTINTDNYIDYTPVNTPSFTSIVATREVGKLGKINITWPEFIPKDIRNNNIPDSFEYILKENETEIYRGTSNLFIRNLEAAYEANELTQTYTLGIKTSYNKLSPFSPAVGVTYPNYLTFILEDNITGFAGVLSRGGILLSFNKYEDNEIEGSNKHNEAEVIGYKIKRQIGTGNFEEIANIKNDGSSVYYQNTDIILGKDCDYFTDYPGYTFKVSAFSNWKESPEITLLPSNLTIDENYTYTPTTSNLNSSVVYAENNAIYIDLPKNYKFYDEYNYYVYQSKTYWNGNNIVSSGTIISTSGNTDIIVSNALNIEARKRLFINGKFYKVENVSNTTITLDTNSEISVGNNFYIFDLIYTGREEVVKIPVIESDESSWFRNWSYGFEVKTIYNYKTTSGITTGIDISNWSDNDSLGIGLLAYYSCDTFDDVLLDNTGSGKHAIKYGSPSISSDSVYGKSVYLDGSSAFLIPHTSWLAPTDYLSISLWIKMDDWQDVNSMSILSKSESGGYSFNRNTVGFTENSTGFILYVNGGYKAVKVSNSLITTGWHHFVSTFDGRYIKLYMDSVLVEINDLGATYPIYYIYNNPVIIGADATQTSYTSPYFTGYLDEIRIYNKALTDIDVNRLYNSGTSLSTTQKLDKYVVIKVETGLSFNYRENANKILRAIVYEDGIDITAGIEPSKFNWKRTSSNSTADDTWNNLYVGSKTALVSPTDYYARGSIYSVEVLD